MEKVIAFVAAPLIGIVLFVGIFAGRGAGFSGAGGGACNGPETLCPPLAGNAIAAAAQMLASHLIMCEGHDACYQGMPDFVVQDWETRCPITANCYSDWQNGNLQCVLYAIAAYDVAGDPVPATGNAIDFWNLYAQRSGWAEISEGQGIPQPGDMVVWAGPQSAGHIAIVISTTSKGFTFGEANGPAPLVFASMDGMIVHNPIAGSLIGFIRHLDMSSVTEQLQVTTPQQFICSLLPTAKLASVEIATGSRGQDHPWYISLIIAQWGIEHDWTLPSTQDGYNLGNVPSLPGYPVASNGLANATSLQQGLAEYVATIQSGTFTSVATAYQQGVYAQAIALGGSNWNANHYATLTGSPGGDLIASIQTYGLTRFDQPGAQCANSTQE